MNRRFVGSVGAVVALVVVLGLARPSPAATGVVRVMIAGALNSPVGTSIDSQITLRASVGLPVSLVSGNAVVPGFVGTATFTQWTDTLPTTGCLAGATGSAAHLSGTVFQLAGMFSSITGVIPADLVLTLTGALP